MNIDFYFSAIDSEYRVKSIAVGYDVQDPAFVTTFNEFGSDNESILAIGKKREEIQNDPGYSTVSQKGEIKFTDPFSIATFHPKFAEAVIRYYLNKIHEAKRNNMKELFRQLLYIIRIDKFSVYLRIPQYNYIDEAKRNIFEKSLSESVMTRNFQIEEAI